MIFALLAVSAIVPSLLLVWYFHARDVYPEPPRVLWTTFGLGILVIWAAASSGSVPSSSGWPSSPGVWCGSTAPVVADSFVELRLKRHLQAAGRA